MSPRKVLGKGLDALIPGGEEREELIYLEVEKIHPSPSQPRENFEPKALEELANSIRRQGILQPLVVRPISNQERGFQLIAGERRLRAAKIAGLKKVPALVKEVNDQQALALSLIENLQREDLNPVEQAKAYQQLTKDFHLTQQELAELLGKERSTIANTLRLLKLPPEIQKELEKGTITPGHARTLLSLDSSVKIKWLFKKIVEQGLSVREAEREAKKLQEEKAEEKRRSRPKDVHLRALEQELTNIIGARLRITQSSRGKGKIEIYFQNLEELERLIGFIKRAK